MAKPRKYLGDAFEALEMAETRLEMALEAARLEGDSTMIKHVKMLLNKARILTADIHMEIRNG